MLANFKNVFALKKGRNFVQKSRPKKRCHCILWIYWTFTTFIYPLRTLMYVVQACLCFFENSHFLKSKFQEKADTFSGIVKHPTCSAMHFALASGV